ncbi:MAG: hypothetical protein AAF649_12725, partial [Verrucomicrobiota bacterium]
TGAVGAGSLDVDTDANGGTGGAITQTGALTVAGTSVLDAGDQDITLTNMGNNFGTVQLAANAASIDDANALNVGASTITNALDVDTAGDVAFTGNVSVGSLNIDTSANGGAGAAITDDAGITLSVTNNASLSGTSITLGDDATDTTNFGTLTFNGTGAVAIAEDSATVLTGTNTALSLDLDSSAGITDAVATSLTVTNNADFNGTSITLGDDAGDTTNFGTLTFNSAGAVTITEDSAMSLTGNNTGAATTLSSSAGVNLAGSVTVNSLEVNAAGGAVTDTSGVTIAVSGFANLNGTSITIGDNGGDTVDFGTLRFSSAGAVAITEDSATILRLDNSASSLDLNSAGTIADQSNTDITVTGLASFEGAAIAIGDRASDDQNFGTLNFNSVGFVAIAEDSATQLTGTNTAGSLDLDSSAGITDAAGTSLTVTNNADFNGTSITLGDDGGDTTDFGTVTFNSAGAVVITEDSATEISGTNTGASLVLTSNGAITDAAGATVTITGTSTFNAGTNLITLDSATSDYQGAVNVTGTSVTVRDVNALLLGTTVSTTNLTLQAGGAISVPNALNVGSGAGTLNILDSAGTTFGNTVMAGTVILTDTTGTIQFQGNLTANTLTTFGQNYNVSLLGASNNITTDTTFINTGSVTLGDAVTDTTTFAGG